MSEALSLLEAITAGQRPSKRVFQLLDTVISGSDTEACLIIRHNRLRLRWWALRYFRRLKRQAATLPTGSDRDDVWDAMGRVNLLIRALDPSRLKRARGILNGPVRCHV